MLSQSRLPFDVGSRVAVQTRHLRLIDGRVYPVPIGLAIVHHWQAGVFDNSVLIGPHIETSMLCDGTVSFQHNVALAVHVCVFSTGNTTIGVSKAVVDAVHSGVSRPRTQYVNTSTNLVSQC
jgi:hypothetical protein